MEATNGTHVDAPTELPERRGWEQLAELGAVILGMVFAQLLPILGVVIGAAVATFGLLVLVNYRGLRPRFLKPVGIERRPNRATPWITGGSFVIVGLIEVGIAISRL